MHNPDRPRLDPDLAAAAAKITPGTPEAPLLSSAKPKATSRQRKAERAKMTPEERRAAESKRKVEAALRRARERLEQANADHRLLHEHKRCHPDCPHCAMARLDELVF